MRHYADKFPCLKANIDFIRGKYDSQISSLESRLSKIRMEEAAISRELNSVKLSLNKELEHFNSVILAIIRKDYDSFLRSFLSNSYYLGSQNHIHDCFKSVDFPYCWFQDYYYNWRFPSIMKSIDIIDYVVRNYNTDVSDLIGYFKSFPWEGKFQFNGRFIRRRKTNRRSWNRSFWLKRRNSFSAICNEQKYGN